MSVKEKNLKDLKNVGKATLRDLNILGIHSVEDLDHKDPTHVFEQLEKQTGKRHDPCMWDVFAAIIHEAKTGEATSLSMQYFFSPGRKVSKLLCFWR